MIMYYERLEHFKDFKTKLKKQDRIIQDKKNFFLQACKTNVNESLQAVLGADLERAEGKKNEIMLDEIRELQELKEVLTESIPDDRIRNILILYYLEGYSLKDIASDMGISYSYINVLKNKGKKVLEGVKI